MLVENKPGRPGPSAENLTGQRLALSTYMQMLCRPKNWAHHQPALKNGLLYALMLVAAGPAVDYSRAFIAQHQLARAVNLTALELHDVSGRSKEYLNKIARRRFQVSYPKKTSDIKARLELSHVDGKIIITASAKIPTLVMSLAGINAVHVSSRSDIDAFLVDTKLAATRTRTNRIKPENIASLQITSY